MQNAVKRVHCVGICGGGMSAIALVLCNQGFIVSGSDIEASPSLQRLHKAGIDCYLYHDAAHVKGCDLLVHSSAVKVDNVEIVAARKARIPILSRAQMLGELMRFTFAIAVAGTHGKTTTSAMIASIFIQAGLDPTVIVGGVLPFLNAGAQLGRGAHLIAEVDESDRSFIHVHPRIAVVTNIDNDHLSAYGHSMKELYRSFSDFLHNLPFYGIAIMCADDHGVMRVLPSLARQALTYGLHPKASLRIRNAYYGPERTEFEVLSHTHEPIEITLSVPGAHNVANACAAIATARQVGIADADIAQSLAAFQNPSRRFQILGYRKLKQGKALIVSDYAHHPTELEATLNAAQQRWPDKRKVIVFQPHRYSRNRDLKQRFVEALGNTPRLLLCDTYAAGESPEMGDSSQQMCDAMEFAGKTKPLWVGPTSNLDNLLSRYCEDGDLIMMLGAGDIHYCAERMVNQPDQTRTPAQGSTFEDVQS